MNLPAIILASLLIGMFGFALGHDYRAGVEPDELKVYVVMDKPIKCQLDVNPVTQEMLE
jgi:hypothetical protein